MWYSMFLFESKYKSASSAVTVVELLIADIGLMKIYQRTVLNKEFYDYRNSAVRRMKRIAEDNNLFVDRHERMRLTYARSEFYIVSAIASIRLIALKSRQQMTSASAINLSANSL